MVLRGKGRKGNYLGVLPGEDSWLCRVLFSLVNELYSRVCPSSMQSQKGAIVTGPQYAHSYCQSSQEP